jgi:hypothetical protein
MKLGYRLDPTNEIAVAKVYIFPATASHSQQSAPAAKRLSQRSHLIPVICHLSSVIWHLASGIWHLASDP